MRTSLLALAAPAVAKASEVMMAPIAPVADTQ